MHPHMSTSTAPEVTQPTDATQAFLLGGKEKSVVLCGAALSSRRSAHMCQESQDAPETTCAPSLDALCRVTALLSQPSSRPDESISLVYVRL